MADTKLILETIVKGTEASRKKITSLKASIDGMEKSTKKASKSLLSFSKDNKKAFLGLTKAVVGLGATIGTASVFEFAEFEKQMSKVKGITNATTEEFNRMNDLAKKMGATTAYTATEAGKAFEFLGMAGLNVRQSMLALPGILELASAGTLELGEAADIATNLMAQYRIKAKDIGIVNDVLAKSATSANTNVQEMAEAMKYLGPVANSLGVSLFESAAAIDVLANNGIKAGMAGQSFASSLLRISKPTKAMTVAMNSAGVQLFDMNGKFVGISDTIRQLGMGMANYTDKQKLATISTIFGVEASKQWLVLLNNGTEELDNYTQSLENSTGAAKKMAKTNIDNLSGSFTLLKSAVSGSMIKIGESINTELRPQIDRLTKELNNNSETTKRFGEIVGTTFKGIIYSIDFLVKAYYNLGAVLGFVAAKVVIFATETIPKAFSRMGEEIEIGKQSWHDFQMVIGGSLVWLGNQISTFLSNIGLWFSERFAQIKAGVSAFANFFKGIWSNVKESVMLSIQGLLDGITEKFNKIKSTAIDFSNSVSDVITGKFTSIVDSVKSKINGLIDYFKRAIAKIKKLGGRIASAVGLGGGKTVDGARAKGGPVQQGKTFLVGEKGPELFSPGQNGMIIPNHKLGGGGGTTINISGVFGTDAVDEIGDQLVSRLQGAVFI